MAMQTGKVIDILQVMGITGSADCYTPLHFAAMGGHTTCVEHLLSTPGIDVNIKGWVSW